MAEKKVVELDIQSNLGSLKEQLLSARQSVQELADRFGASSQQVADAADNVRALEKEIKQTSKTLKSIGIEGKFTAITGSITGVLNGFQAVQGSLGVIGIESKNVEAALLKVQSAMALADGVEGLFKAQTSFKRLKDIGVGAFQGMTTAGKAFAATGIGLLITAIGLLITNIDDIKKSFNSGLATAKKYAETTEKQAEAARKAVDNFDEYARTLKRVGYEEDEINKKRKAAYAKAIKDTEAQLKAQKNVLKESKKGLETAQAFDSWGFNATGRWLYGDEEDVKENRKKAKEINEQLTKLKNDQYDFNEKIKAEKEQAKKDAETEKQNRAKEYAEKRKEMRDQAAEEARIRQEIIDKANADAKRNALEKQQELNQRFEDLAEQNYQNTLTEQEKEIVLVNDKYFELETLAAGNKDALAEIEVAKMNELNDINLKYQDLDYKQKEEARAKEKAAQDKADADRIEAEKAVAETLKQVRNADFNNIQAGINLVANLFEGNKKVQAAALVAQNAVAIAKTIIETKASNQAARASGTALSIATGGASVAAAEALILRNNIGAGISIAAIVAATGKGLSALKAGGYSSGGGNISDSGGGTGSGVMSANFNVVGNSGFNQLAQLQQTPTKAYVVSGDMTTAQALDRNRIENATLVQ